MKKMTGYEQIKAMAKEKSCRVTDLLVLARHNDPFYAGSETSRAMAEWFAALWQKFGYTKGVHLRRVHYQLVSQGDAVKHNGTAYQNTEADWDYLCAAGKYARYLGLVDPFAFVDRRNPEPHIFTPEETAGQPGWYAGEIFWEMPEITVDLDADLDWELPGFAVTGYTYSEALQPYHLELWVEKSTMDDVLLPLCRRYGTNLVTGLGFMSVTSVVQLIRRAAERGKPARIFYIADFDPAGDGMPVAVSRQVEYWVKTLGFELDIKLEHLALTQEQVEAYRLPRIPVKETDRRKTGFEQRHGQGAVELDALEALHPGELARIVSSRILQFRDPRLWEKLAAACQEAEEILAQHWEGRLGPFREELEELNAEVAAITRRYEEQLRELQVQMEQDLEPYRKRLEMLRLAVQNTLESLDVELPPLPEPETPPEQGDWLFDSGRDCFAQLAAYRTRKKGTL